MNAEQAIADHQRMLIHAAEDMREIAALRAQNDELVALLKKARDRVAIAGCATDWQLDDLLAEIDALLAAGHTPT